MIKDEDIFETEFELKELSEESLEEYIEQSLSGDEDYEEMSVVSRKTNAFVDSSQKASASLPDLAEKIRMSLQSGDVQRARVFLGKATKQVRQLFFDLMSVEDLLGWEIGGRVESSKDSIWQSEGDVEIENVQDGVWKITLPGLLPSKKLRKMFPKYNSAYTQPIIKALNEAFPEYRERYRTKADVVVCHTFGEGKKVMDPDNFDYSPLINCISQFFLKDDSPEFINLHYTGRRGERSYSEVWLMPETLFLELWNTLKN